MKITVMILTINKNFIVQKDFRKFLKFMEENLNKDKNVKFKEETLKFINKNYLDYSIKFRGSGGGDYDGGNSGGGNSGGDACGGD